MRIRLVAVSGTLGGAELYLLNLGEALDRAGADVTIVGGQGPVAGAARSRGLAVEELRIGHKLSQRTALANVVRFPFARRSVRELVRKDGWTVLQFKWEQLLWGGETAPERVCLLEHGPIPQRLLDVPWARHRVRNGLHRARVVAAVSEPAAESIHALADRDPVWLPAGVRTSVNGAAAEWRRRYAPTGTLVAYAGRIARDKGIFELAALAGERSGLNIAIAGDGPDAEPLRRWVDANGVADRVHLPGFVDDAVPLLAAADATVLATTETGEGRPLAALESIGVGTPVIGLRSSAALRALAGEFPSAVRLVETKEPAELLAAIEAAVAADCQPQPVGTWDETAAILLQALEDGNAAR